MLAQVSVYCARDLDIGAMSGYWYKWILAHVSGYCSRCLDINKLHKDRYLTF